MMAIVIGMDATVDEGVCLIMRGMIHVRRRGNREGGYHIQMQNEGIQNQQQQHAYSRQRTPNDQRNNVCVCVGTGLPAAAPAPARLDPRAPWRASCARRNSSSMRHIPRANALRSSEPCACGSHSALIVSRPESEAYNEEEDGASRLFSVRGACNWERMIETQAGSESERSEKRQRTNE